MHSSPELHTDETLLLHWQAATEVHLSYIAGTNFDHFDEGSSDFFIVSVLTLVTKSIERDFKAYNLLVLIKCTPKAHSLSIDDFFARPHFL